MPFRRLTFEKKAPAGSDIVPSLAIPAVDGSSKLRAGTVSGSGGPRIDVEGNDFVIRVENQRAGEELKTRLEKVPPITRKLLSKRIEVKK